MIVADSARMTAISKKGALNPDAAGLEDLWTLCQPFELVDGGRGRQEEDRTRESSGVEIEPPPDELDRAATPEQSEATATDSAR